MNNSVADRRSPLGLFLGQPAPRLYDGVVEVLRTRHYSRRTQRAYLRWIHRLLLFHTGAHPRKQAESEVLTTMVYTHVLNRGGRGIHSPLDRLRKPSPVRAAGLIIRTDRSA